MKALGIYIVAYDFSNNKLRSKIGNTLENYGRRIQKSVFRCFLSAEQIQELKFRTDSILKKHSDNLQDTDSIIIIEDIKESKITELFTSSCNVKNEKIFF